jgi:hypothetical protein
MGVENDSNTRVTRVFRQVQTSVRIIIIHPMLLCIMICWIETPSTPHFICQEGRVYKEDPNQL